MEYVYTLLVYVDILCNPCNLPTNDVRHFSRVSCERVGSIIRRTQRNTPREHSLVQPDPFYVIRLGLYWIRYKVHKSHFTTVAERGGQWSGTKGATLIQHYSILYFILSYKYKRRTSLRERGHVSGSTGMTYEKNYLRLKICPHIFE